MSIDHVRLSEKAKQQLITLKKRTGIDNWNILCRWALCLSLSEKSIPPHEDIITDSSVEMTWKTFGGEHADLYLAILKERYNEENYHNEDINYFFKLHLHRGISYLLNSVQKLEDLINI
ncbi:DNA sulfur modification protein DndE [Enterobacter asburiae]|uniref:DNA sulfur modification protein DndE n=1 Tax=Enterobacter asburiae TaxID=61645 RepID=UPI0020060AAE|nr:DNA sulfur modification protein DndE [Enterobacter asburiae]MCK7227876.1 DNA sulfur modification protein DndE [Enterobacter asburiae]